MRFPQLALGQHFSYQGKRYTKTGPLTASEADGGNPRMIPRSAEVTPLDAAGEPVRELKRRYAHAELEAQIKRFKADLADQLREMASRQGTLQLDSVLRLIASLKPGA
jgi:hypothetical protein